MPDPNSLRRVLEEHRIRRAVEARLAAQGTEIGYAYVPRPATLVSDPAVTACLNRGHYPDFHTRPVVCRTCGYPYPCGDDATQLLPLVTDHERRLDWEEIGLLASVLGLVLVAVVFAVWGA